MGLGRLVLLGLCGLALAAADPSPSQRDAAEVFPLLICAHACAVGERERAQGGRQWWTWQTDVALTCLLSTCTLPWRAGVAACGKSAAQAGCGAVRAVCAGGLCWCARLWAVMTLTDLYLPELVRGQGVPVGYGLMMDAG
jgi:hypothetical protein